MTRIEILKLIANQEAHSPALAAINRARLGLRWPTAAPLRPVKVWKLAGYDSLTEMRYAAMLEQLRLGRQILAWRHHPRRLRLPGTRYTPDFAVLERPRRVVMVEVKGYERYADTVRFKSAAELYPCWGWRLVKLERGKWIHTREIPPRTT